MQRPSSTADTIVEKLSSARTMSAASLDTSVPVIPMATPIAACWSAGASLTPSPVIAGISFRLCNIFTSFCLSAGSARQNTIFPDFNNSSCSSSFFSKNSRPSYALIPVAFSLKMFTSLAIATAVSLASPVIIITRIPASVHSFMLSATSGRAGSLIPTIPTNVKPLSISLYVAASDNNGCLATSPSFSSWKSCKLLSSSFFSFTANAKHRNGLTANSVVFSSMDRRRSPVSLATVPSRNFT
mmetsp:Transcript_24043/g.27011  ORF Transcript_24043/g.27011 Transcript_24043/m.27011 type:complete len:242 (-) Transcript_24043:138-863(-)